MKEIVEAIRTEVNEKRLYNSVKEVSNFHRIQASPGFRAAAQAVCAKMKDEGIEARVLSFEANYDKWYLEQKMFDEWRCDDAWLQIAGLGRIADFKAEPISIVQKSYPAIFLDGCEVVLVEDFDDDYVSGLNLKDKILFVHTMPTKELLGVIKKYGAKGFISDFMREVPGIRSRNDAYDTLNYTSFWWEDIPEEPHTFGFVISPRNGDLLRKLCIEKQAEGCYPMAYGKVDSALYPGHMEVVEAVVPGQTADEILLCGHLCHPRASANDNASGVAAGMEALRTLKRLQDDQKIPPLQKTIRLILVPEMTGSYCYLSTLKDYSHIKGAINLDMVGGKQDGFYGPITITATHHGLNSPMTSIAAMVLKYVQRQALAFMGDPVPLVNAIIAKYSGGSDHTIFSDPSIGVPCIMLGQWPDKYYHTSSDTLECVDPKVLAFSTIFAASFVYALSNYDNKMHREAMMAHGELLLKDLDSALEKRTETTPSHIAHLVHFYEESVSSFDHFGKVVGKADQAFICQMADSVLAWAGMANMVAVNKDPRFDYIPVRHFVGPIRQLSYYKGNNEEVDQAIDRYQKEASAFGFMFETYILNYLDGKRTINEIYEGIYGEYEVGSVEVIDLYCQALEKIGKIVRMERC